MTMVGSKFTAGALVWTAGVNERVTQDLPFARFIADSLKRHLTGDWGDLCEEDKKENEFSLENGFRILSAYNRDGTKIWIITEQDRSSTTVLFPEEY